MGYLSDDQIQKSNKIHQVIKFFRELFPKEFEKCDIKQCSECKGKGFIQSHNYGIYFSGLGGVCQKCNGVGFIGFIFLGKERVCKCNGVGCDACSYKGTVDWVDAVMKGCK